jgi:hypothetical protein
MEKVIGFPICKKANQMPLLLQKMSEMDAPGRVPKAFSTYNKQYPHIFVSVHIGASCQIVPSLHEILMVYLPSESADIYRYLFLVKEGALLSIMRVAFAVSDKIQQ